MRQEDFDVIIVGARVGGSTTAALLGDLGHRVLLLDREAFPSSTLSTHFFRGSGLVAILRQLDLLDDVLGLGSPPLRYENYYLHGGREPQRAPAQEPGDLGYSLSVRREPLDAMLLERAYRCPTVTFRQRCSVVGLLREEDRVTGVTLASPNGPESVRARLVVGADGRRSVVARFTDPVVEEAAEPLRALYYCYVRGFTGPAGGLADAAEFSVVGDEMAYLFPSDAGLCCMAVSVNKSRFDWLRASLTDRFQERIRDHPGFADRFATATVEGRVLGSGPEPNFMRIPAGPGWALVGDAGLHQDPWTGRGMDMASVHASFLAESIDTWLKGTTPELGAMAAYHRRRNEHAIEAFRETVTFGRDLRAMVAAVESSGGASAGNVPSGP